MTKAELDQLLDGATGVTLHRKGAPPIYLERRALEDPQAMRAAMRRARVSGDAELPIYTQDQHDEIVRAIFKVVEGSD